MATLAMECKGFNSALLVDIMMDGLPLGVRVKGVISSHAWELATLDVIDSL